MTKVTVRQIRLLEPYLEGDQPTHINRDRDTGEETREWNMHCPLPGHSNGDNRRSGSLNLDKGLYYCFVCGGMPVTSLIRRQDEWTEIGYARRNGGHANVNANAPDKKQRLISKAMVDGYNSALLSNVGALQWLRENRLLDNETIAKYRIGIQDGRLYTIPVFDEEGTLVNIRYYNPNPPPGTRKIWSESGYGSPPYLYPLSVLADDPEEVIIGGGEWDALACLRFGEITITRTAGEDYWNSAWSPLFKDRIVYLGHDADEKGDVGNRKVARALFGVAREVRQLQLPYERVKKHGPDLTNVLQDFGPEKIREMKSESTLLEKKARVADDEPETVTVLDTFDAKRVGVSMRVIVTVKGRKEPGYTIPNKVRLTCTQDAGNKCLACKLNAHSGEATVEITADDPAVLALMDAPTDTMRQVIAENYGVPGGRCAKLQQEVEEHQAVEILFARPALDYSDGTKAGEYKNIKITSVGRHDTLANNTIVATGALHPNPRDQRNEFLAHKLEVLETSVDRFEINDDTVALMRRFQAGDRSPLHKVAEISKQLATHVTLIQGRPEMHALIDLTFHSVLDFNFGGEYVGRGWVESIILGDTGTGKSSAASRIVRHFGAGEIVSCEAATFAGIVGGLQQIGGKDWAVTWGSIPINDRRLVVLDEISGLAPEEIAEMSDIRSSGQAKLTKIQQEVTWARTRLLWMGNPRNATMANYTYGVDALRPLIGNAEDIARFDLAMAVTKYDVSPSVINRRHEVGELLYTPEACHTLLMWCWTRRAEHVTWGEGSEDVVYQAANHLGGLYIEDPPLILAASVRIKVARLAVAIAARLFSTDETCQQVRVLPGHVEAARQFIELLYGMQTFGYRERSREMLADRAAAEAARDDTSQYLKGRPLLVKHLRSAGKFRRQDLEEILNISREEANGIINTLYEKRMVRRILGDIYVEPTLHTLLREMKF